MVTRAAAVPFPGHHPAVVATAIGPALVKPTVACPPGCDDAGWCAYCNDMACHTHENVVPAPCSGAGEYAHAICHHNRCADASCWIDPDDWMD